MSRVFGLDYGSKTIGVAVSDPSSKIALGIETIRRTRENALRASFRRLNEIISKYTEYPENPQTATIIIGYPKNMDNSEGERCAKTLLFKEKLAARFVSVPIILWDERLSTEALKHTLNNAEKIDEMAAVFILQGYLDYLQNTPNPPNLAQPAEPKQEITETIVATETIEAAETAEIIKTAETIETAETAETAEIIKTAETIETAETAETAERGV